MEAEMMRTLNAGVLAGCVCTVICVVWETARGRDASIKLHCPGHLSPFRAPRWETGSDTVSRGALLRARPVLGSFKPIRRRRERNRGPRHAGPSGGFAAEWTRHHQGR